MKIVVVAPSVSEAQGYAMSLPRVAGQVVRLATVYGVVNDRYLDRLEDAEVRVLPRSYRARGGDSLDEVLGALPASVLVTVEAEVV